MCIFHSTVKEVFIVSGLKTTDVFVGEWATFSCQLSGKATGKVQWWLDGTWLENSPSSEMGLSQGHIHTLTLKNLATDDSGTVTFKAGSVVSTAKLLVKGIRVQVKERTTIEIQISFLWTLQQTHGFQYTVDILEICILFLIEYAWEIGPNFPGLSI